MENETDEMLDATMRAYYHGRGDWRRTPACPPLSDLLTAGDVPRDHAGCTYCVRLLALSARIRADELGFRAVAPFRLGPPQRLVAPRAAYLQNGRRAVRLEVPPPLRLDDATEIRVLRDADQLVDIVRTEPGETTEVLVLLVIKPTEGAVWQRYLVLRPVEHERLASCRVSREAIDLTQENEFGVLIVTATELIDPAKLEEGYRDAVTVDPGAAVAWRRWAIAVLQEGLTTPELADWLRRLRDGQMEAVP